MGGLAAAFLARAWSADGTELSRIAAWADILAMLLAVGGLVLVVADKRRARHEITPESLMATVDRLASDVLRVEAKQRAQLLGTDAPSARSSMATARHPQPDLPLSSGFEGKW